MKPRGPSARRYFLLHGFSEQLGGSVGFTLVASSGGSVECIRPLTEWTPIAGGINWAVSIVIYGTADLTSAFYSQGCDELMCFKAILITRRY
jgi:hypothetical protein